MKPLAILALLTMLAETVLGQANSNLSITTTGSSNLKIIFAGKKYSLQDRSVTFQSLSPGKYSLVLFQWQRKNQGGGEYVRVFDNTVTMNANDHVEVCVLRFGKVVWDAGKMEKDEWNENYRNPSPDEYGDRGSAEAVGADQFEKIKQALRKESYDANRLGLAKVILRNNYFTSGQIIELAKLFIYDNERLSFVKHAYESCVDKGNYFLVADCLIYPSNKEELLKYIGSR